MDDAGSWPYLVAANLDIGSSVTAIARSRRDPALPRQHWPRGLHTVAAGALNSGAYAYAAASTMLVYGVFQFPAPKAGP
ncbi:hypothetical protein [Streptomyces sp. NBC_00083]|uniref:hypothetical protein n=1 Tax=Streptomyces sp. NBC_00083 TaxID=2975647 RepID=UPI0022580D7A|nr:hypothetical protein [Streptomyces sp. NBC_00083]